MSGDIKYMDIKEFYRLGFLQEANRLFFHPRGLALSVNIDDETGEMTLDGIWDYRDDPEGLVFADTTDPSFSEKARRVAQEHDRHVSARIRLFNSGDSIQRLGTKMPTEPKED